MSKLMLLGVLALLAVAVAVGESPTTVRADCPASCGGVDIPYPFGVGPNCFRKGFEISCDDMDSPVLADTNISVVHLSVDPAGLKVMLRIGYQCYNASDDGETLSSRTYSGETMMNQDGVYRISNTRNMLVVLGCNTDGFMYTRRTKGRNFSGFAGCTSYCYDTASAKDGECAGVGCCHVNIPPDLTNNYFYFSKYNHSGLMDYSPCDYAFLVDTTNYTFTRSDLKMDFDRTSPVWLDWAIRDKPSCARAARTPEYACKSHLHDCTGSINGPGYTCKCPKGYEGNAYLPDGCTDIDECAHLDKYRCFGVCKNTPGSYDCTCPRGQQSNDAKSQPCDSKFSFMAKITIGIILVAFIVVVLMLSTKMIIQKRTLKALYEKNGGLKLQNVESLEIYDKEDIKKITNNNSDFLGKGRFGNVYKGTLPNNTMVAVKESIVVKNETKEEFIEEVKILSKMSHKNILKLFGCCLEVDVPKLVYEYAAQGSLNDTLHVKRDKQLPLDMRLDIAIGSAEGLRYMHMYTTQVIRHGDVKPDNILLDGKFVPKISDFGLSRMLEVDQYFTKVVVGCIGYVDPVFLKTGLITQKSDVYSFGAVLLELITRKPNMYNGNCSLIMEFRKVCEKEGSGRTMFDADIAVGEDVFVLEEIGRLAIECLNEDVQERPDMAEVAERLTMLRRSRKHGRIPSKFEEVTMNDSPGNSSSSGTTMSPI